MKLKERVKTLFLNGFKSKNIQHHLFDVGRSEAKRLMVTKRGLQEIKRYDKELHRLTSRYVSDNKLTAKEFSKQIDRWAGQLKVKTGDTKTSFRRPSKVHHTLTKVGSVGRPLEIIHMDLADVNRLNPDSHVYRYPLHTGGGGCFLQLHGTRAREKQERRVGLERREERLPAVWNKQKKQQHLILPTLALPKEV